MDIHSVALYYRRVDGSDCEFQPTRSLVEEHYAKYKDERFHVQWVEHMMHGPVIPMVWEGTNIIELSHRMIGHFGPFEATPGTIHGDFSPDREHSVIHSAHSCEAAAHEIHLWFHEHELIEWKSYEHH